MQYLGVHDTDSTTISTQDLATHAFVNLTTNDAESYIVRHSRQPAQDFPPLHEDGHDDLQDLNVWEQAYPLLFPYGEGGLEHQRLVSLSLQEHIRWALRYHDGRFRVHPTFAFMGFGILQCRQAL